MRNAVKTRAVAPRRISRERRPPARPRNPGHRPADGRSQQPAKLAHLLRGPLVAVALPSRSRLAAPRGGKTLGPLPPER